MSIANVSSLTEYKFGFSTNQKMYLPGEVRKRQEGRFHRWRVARGRAGPPVQARGDRLRVQLPSAERRRLRVFLAERGGCRRGMRSLKLSRLVLGCIEADFCNQIFIFHNVAHLQESACREIQ